MNHEQAEKLLGAMIFDDLDEASKARLMTYLETDPDLRESLADLRMALKVTAHAVQHGSEPVLSDTRLRRLEKLSRSGSHSRITLYARWVAVAACMAIVVGLVMMPSLNKARSVHNSPQSLGIVLSDRVQGEGVTDREESMPRIAGPGMEVAKNIQDMKEAGDAMVNLPARLGSASISTPPAASRSYYGRQLSQQMQGQDARDAGGDIAADTETALFSRSDSPVESPARQPASHWFSRSSRDNSDLVALNERSSLGPEGLTKGLDVLPSDSLSSVAGGESQEVPEPGLEQGTFGYYAAADKDGDVDSAKKDLEALRRNSLDYSAPALVPTAPTTSTPSSLATELSTRRSASGSVAADSYGMGVGGMMGGGMGGMGGGVQRGRERLGEATTRHSAVADHGITGSTEEAASRFGEYDGIASSESKVAGQSSGQLAKAKSETKGALLGDVPLVGGLFRKSNRAQVETESGSLSSQASQPEKVLLQTKVVAVDEDVLQSWGFQKDVPSEQASVPSASKPGNTSSEFTLPPASRFKLMPVNPWVLTEQDALSTFALDVDTASYALCRQYIQHGYLPPAGAVRMEEFVNAFDYAYPQRSEPTFSVMAEGAPSPFAGPGQALTLVKIAVKARTVGRDQRKAAHLVFVVDASASMGQADRLPLIQQGLNRLVEELGPEDRVSVVSCSDQARLLADHVSAGDQEALIRTIREIQPSGSTNLLSGLQLGYATAKRSFVAGQINQVILCSDGVANVGATEAESVLEAVAEDRKQGIMLMCVGVGYGAYNDVLLEALANRGDGRYVFVDASDQVERVFVRPLAAALQTVAKDARIQVKFNPDAVRRYRLIGYENRDIKDEQFRNDTIDAGEVGSGQCATALYEIELVSGRPGDAGDLGTVFVRFQDTNTHKFDEIARPLARSLIQVRHVADSPRFYLAASAARFAEWLRQSEHARTTTLGHILTVVDRVSAALPLDQNIRELADLIRQAEGLPRAP